MILGHDTECEKIIFGLWRRWCSIEPCVRPRLGPAAGGRVDTRVSQEADVVYNDEGSNSKDSQSGTSLKDGGHSLAA